MPGRSGRARSLIFDALLALGITTLNWSIALQISVQLDAAPRALLLAFVTVHSMVLALRRVRPWLAYGTNLAAGLVAVVLGAPFIVLTIAPVAALYSIATQAPARRSLFALGTTIAAFFAGEAATSFPDDLGTIAGNLVVLAATWLIGWFVFGRQEYVRQLEAKTAALMTAREELARTAVTEERLRIARELHDIIAHSLSMIAVQSGVGAHVIDDRPEDAKAVLLNVEQASRGALNEMRALLGMLRDVDGTAGRTPLPGLADLSGLIEQVERAGPTVDVQVRGDERSLPSGLDLTAYRVIQESLTNIVRHAGAERARVNLNFTPASLVIEIVDDGRAAAAPSNGGLGIEGMRERLAAFGGSLDAGPLPEGGFRVRAELPVPEVPA
ncbi:MAG: sensor histidine kinase [Actinomycetota bacterium]